MTTQDIKPEEQQAIDQLRSVVGSGEAGAEGTVSVQAVSPCQIYGAIETPLEIALPWLMRQGAQAAVLGAAITALMKALDSLCQADNNDNTGGQSSAPQ